MPAPKRVQVAILEQDLHYRLFLEAHLSAHPRYQPLYSAATADDALRWPDSPAPELLLIETSGLPANGSAVIAALHQRYPGALPLVLTTREDGPAVLAAVQAGAVGYLLKQSGKDTLFDALDQTLAGGSPLTPRVARELLRLLATTPEPRPSSAPPFATLTELAALPQLSPRETQILSLVAVGTSDKGIGEQLGLARSTVKNALLGIFGKWQVRTRTEAAVKFMQYQAEVPTTAGP
ncbi:LuxR C-terminal-related transcriptional regulator [Actomonas aquatica]|uniref:Response regulator transcription factor n=1 Tax=Actomonas aquatica TaxID=2866162 RepID=A0ABZ1C5H9_9BACT|nr:response regulator transcription factor [Opitutus sp. WL0086]WRQ86984.1 response regulator transcription factor [Opitutus sp. WL0086]